MRGAILFLATLVLLGVLLLLLGPQAQACHGRSSRAAYSEGAGCYSESVTYTYQSQTYATPQQAGGCYSGGGAEAGGCYSGGGFPTRYGAGRGLFGGRPLFGGRAARAAFWSNR
jgi:hypothetical protein